MTSDERKLVPDEPWWLPDEDVVVDDEWDIESVVDHKFQTLRIYDAEKAGKGVWVEADPNSWCYTAEER